MPSRRTFLTSLAALPAVAQTSASGPTRVRIDAESVTAHVNPNIFGEFIEHLGRCIYGGVYEPGSPLSDSKGFRKDVLKAVDGLKPPVLRWPGGNYVSGYYWEDGIGAKSERKKRFDQAWFAEESNQFGTDEFLEYCRMIGAEPYLCVNLGTGTIQDAANWVEYCNGTTDTHYANLRRKNGHPEPYKVKYWGLGNELYGPWQAGSKPAEEYAKIALEAGKMMKWVDPEIQLIACGAGPDWNLPVLEIVGPICDYISVHYYAGNDDYYDTLGSVKGAEHHLRLTDSAIDLAAARRKGPAPNRYELKLPQKPRIEIAFDEWNIWYRRRDGRDRQVKNKLEEPYNLRDALWTASMIHLFQRWGDKVTMANLAQMVNVIAPITTSPQGLFLQPTYFPLELYRQQSGNQVLETKVRGPVQKTTHFGEIDLLDVCTTSDGKWMSIGVVNRDKDNDLTAEFEVLGAKPGASGKVYTVNGPSPDAVNSFTQPDVVKLVSRDASGFGARFRFDFPKHSVTMLKIPL